MKLTGYRAGAMLLILAGASAFLFSHTSTPPAGAAVGITYLEMPMPNAPAPGVQGLSVAGPPIPPTGAPWHELSPNFCAVWPQEAYGDNGDGVISVCDGIKFGGVVYHIDWVGPTYVLRDLAGLDHYFEPDSPGGGNPYEPVCEIWNEVHPDHGMQRHVDNWQDSNGDGRISACDVIILGGVPYHVEDVRLDIQVTPGGTPVEPSTWSKIKTRLWPF